MSASSVMPIGVIASRQANIGRWRLSNSSR